MVGAVFHKTLAAGLRWPSLAALWGGDRPPVVLGLMSGTSMDGIDLGLIRTDGESGFGEGPSATHPYPAPFRARLADLVRRAAAEPQPQGAAEIEAELTRLHAVAVAGFRAGLPLAWQPALIGFHGHTLRHAPARRESWALGDGPALARATGLPVVDRMRADDVAAGGQGAPLAPAWHLARAVGLPRPVGILNLGGVGNLTWIGAGEQIIAFDTGPANALIDDLMLEATGAPVDRDGTLGAAGRVDEAVLAQMLAHPFFAQPAPKSLDRLSFGREAVAGLGLADAVATLTAFTAAAVAAGLRLVPACPQALFVTGGGRLNPTMMRMLAERCAVAVRPVEALGWNGDALEAEAFAYLAARAARGLPLSWPGTTGVPAAMTGGTLALP